MANKIKISQLPAKDANLQATDLLEISEFTGTGYITKSITGQEIIDSASGTGVTDITVNSPLSTTGGTTPDLSISEADGSTDGYVTAIDWNTFNGKQNELVSGTNIKTLNGASLLGSGGLSVQPTLVSGTNIKTINSTSILGSGDIAISSGVTDVTGSNPIVSTGGATPDISIRQSSNVDDGYLSSTDWNTFNGKQPTLVSGTNIKTINGSSVLGSGDLAISGGSGIKGLHNVFGYFDSTVYGITAQLNGTSMTPVIMLANQLYTYPFFPNKTITSVSLRINVSTLGVGTNCRILIYSDNNGQPNAKLYESANLDCSTTGIKTAITSFTFTAGTVYWLCVQSSGTTSLTGIQPPALIPLQNTSSLLSIPVVTYINTSAFGSAPATFVINNRSNSTVPMVQIYLS